MISSRGPGFRDPGAYIALGTTLVVLGVIARSGDPQSTFGWILLGIGIPVGLLGLIVQAIRMGRSSKGDEDE